MVRSMCYAHEKLGSMSRYIVQIGSTPKGDEKVVHFSAQAEFGIGSMMNYLVQSLGSKLFSE